ncbi:carbohydrate ABC transporter permease [Candidatus Mycoplasma pogonae]
MYNKKWFFILLLPSLFVFTVVLLVPSILGIVLSFTDWKTGEEMFSSGWIGFWNYKAAFENGSFGESIGYTAVFGILSVIFVNVIGFGLAFALSRAFRGRNLFRSVFFIPNLIGGLILGYLWRLMFDEVFKAIFGGETLRLSGRWEAMLAMAIVFAWQMAGYVMLIYLAALQNVNKSLLEAAKIEGASKWRILRSVIIPSVMPAITISVFLSISGAFKMFDQNLALTDGHNNSKLISFDIYDAAFNPSLLQTLGIAQAKSFIFTILVAAIGITQVYIAKRFEVKS